MKNNSIYLFSLKSCVVEKYFESQSNRGNKLKTVQLINCSFSADDWQTNVTNAVNKCYQQIFNNDFSEIYKCAEEHGNDLLDRMGNETNKLDPKLTYVPWITFNFIRNAESENNFLESVCNRVICHSSATNSHLNMNSLISLILLIIYYSYVKID
jgi:hypothetical protein